MNRKKTIDQVAGEPAGSFKAFIAKGHAAYATQAECERRHRAHRSACCVASTNESRLAFISGQWIPCPLCTKAKQ